MMFVSHFQAYADPLTRIIHEYDVCITYLRQAHDVVHAGRLEYQQAKVEAEGELAKGLIAAEELATQKTQEVRVLQDRVALLEQQAEALKEACAQQQAQLVVLQERNTLLSTSIIDYRLQQQKDAQKVQQVAWMCLSTAYVPVPCAVQGL